MEENKEDHYSLGDIARHIKSFLVYLRRKSWLLILAAVLGAVLGAVAYYKQKPKYVAECTFILEEKQSGMGGLSSIASQFNIDVGGLSGGGSIFAGDNILDILKSRNIIQKVLLSRVDSTSNSPTLADMFLEFSGWKEKWSRSQESKDSGISYAGLAAGKELSVQQDSVLNLLYDYLSLKSVSAERVDKKGTIIKVKVIAAHPYFAKLMTERIIEQSKSFYITVKTNTAQQNVSRLERKSDSLLALLNNKSFEAADAIVLDANPAFKTLSVPSELKMRDKNVLGALYTEIIKNLEISRISLSQQMPVIQILDKPKYPIPDSKMGRTLIIAGFSFASLLLTIMVLGLVKLLSSALKVLQ
ncbi:hypothetical protein V9K67_08910 [Paraflavisolibacter sp. H34]|uniref:hypothetical protein n=1 Tax=Huijunlia imazamoxiresistens TaxID=3127457 RepID=UPI00301675B9